MPKYKVEFSRDMDNVSFDQIASIERFLVGAIVPHFDDEADTWEVVTSKRLDRRLMNTALARAGILDATTVEITLL